MKWTYRKAGVNIEAGYEVIKRIKKHTKKTKIPGVLGSIGAFSGFFKPEWKKYKNPILVSATDGVGTKIKCATEWNMLDTVGIDLVGMSVNDLAVCGAQPLFFLDYIACHKIEPKKIEKIVKGIAAGCKQAGCALIGGETAEMNDLYKKGDIDLAGFAVGIVEKSKIIDGSKVKKGDVIVGIPSNGIHSNGYSLVRKVLNKKNASQIMKPTKIYVKEIQKIIRKTKVHGIAHITGGGLPENISRILPKKCNAVIDASSWKPHSIFKKIQDKGKITTKEMFKIFNMGIGIAIILPANEAKKIKKYPTIGKIAKGNKKVIIQ
ncbi:phosphoribosylformylglycinamidine cyclo-ligase [Candidatus Margulisiibacteriota bacterium]